MQRICFSIMPFEGFGDIAAIIGEAARASGLDHVRGDHSARSGSVLAHIISDIERARVIVADITRLNANVFYELGIAHRLKGPERVVIITQKVDPTAAYDVHQFRQLEYKHTEAGRAALREQLPGRLLEAANVRPHEELWNVTSGRLHRTRLIVSDLKRALESGTRREPSRVMIRIAAVLGSLAISDSEPLDTRPDPEYFDALLEERNLLRRLLARGGHLKGVLNPPRRLAQSMLPARLKVRFARLIGLLEGRSDAPPGSRTAADDLAAIARCEFTLSPVPMPNLFIINDTAAYEGVKRVGAGGFERTYCETDPSRVRDRIVEFDRFFAESQEDLARYAPPDGRLLEQLRACYEEAVAAK